jgi:hypothetical protein
MKFLSALLPLLCATLVTANLSLFGSDQTPLAGDNPLAVPGKNPLTVSRPHLTLFNTTHSQPVPMLTSPQYCADPADYILSIDYVDLEGPPPPPPPPHRRIMAQTVSHIARCATSTGR